MFYNFMVEKVNFRMLNSIKKQKLKLMCYGQNFLLISASWKICFNMRWDVSWVLTFDAKKSFYSRSASEGAAAAISNYSWIASGANLKTKRCSQSLFPLFTTLHPQKLTHFSQFEILDFLAQKRGRQNSVWRNFSFVMSFLSPIWSFKCRQLQLKWM